jgi:hypothetical protein
MALRLTAIEQPRKIDKPLTSSGSTFAEFGRIRPERWRCAAGRWSAMR